MDQFELARQKNEKRLERLARSNANREVPQQEIIQPEPQKQKAGPDAVVTVSVALPDKTYTFTLTKQAVYANAVPAKLTQIGFVNAIRDGLKPLLGEMK